MRYLINDDSGSEAEVQGFDSHVRLTIHEEQGKSTLALTAEQVVELQFALNRARTQIKGQAFAAYTTEGDFDA